MLWKSPPRFQNVKNEHRDEEENYDKNREPT